MEKRFLLSRRQLLVSTVGLAVSACKPEDSAIITTNSDVIDGYMQEQSYAPGDVALIYVNAKTQARQKLSLQDVNGQEVFSFEAQVQPQVVTNAQPWADGFGYVNPVIVTTPNVKSGVYFWNGKIRCIIRARRNTTPNIVVVYPSNTENAYNPKGGKSLYVPAAAPAVEVSYHRPWDGTVYYFTKSYYQWLLTQSDYNMLSHISDYDMDDYENIRGAKLLVIIGHSEYWTRKARESFDRFVDEGAHALVLSGNTMWWQARYSDNRDRMICYKYNASPEPLTSPLRTTVWSDKVLAYPILSSIGADFVRGGYGLRTDVGWNGMRITQATSPIFKGLSLQSGDIISLPTLEYDGAPLLAEAADNGDPIIDNSKLGFYRVDLIGYDFGDRSLKTTATWMVFQKKHSSGFVINGASTDWGSIRGMGGVDGASLKVIVRNMMDLLLQNIYPI